VSDFPLTPTARAPGHEPESRKALAHAAIAFALGASAGLGGFIVSYVAGDVPPPPFHRTPPIVVPRIGGAMIAPLIRRPPPPPSTPTRPQQGTPPTEEDDG
jgi:hypothetical protein